MTFMDDYMEGRIDGLEMGTYVGQWTRDMANHPFSTPELAEYLGMTREQLAEWMRYRTLPERGAP